MVLLLIATVRKNGLCRYDDDRNHKLPQRQEPLSVFRIPGAASI
jgi:hypothetical protein